ncbi:MAG: hypothetical protein L0220_18800, partial [Acidobacteria bacterium]|nr:hypothetical protein [Acidobacteriota bacterium]
SYFLPFRHAKFSCADRYLPLRVEITHFYRKLTVIFITIGSSEAGLPPPELLPVLLSRILRSLHFSDRPAFTASYKAR